MLQIKPYNQDTSGEPVVTFATDAEIAIADQLRHRLEQRYLAPSIRGDARSSDLSEA